MVGEIIPEFRATSPGIRNLYNCAGNSPCRRAITDKFAPGAVASVSVS